MKKTSLYEQHKKQKAKLLPFAGFHMPLTYSSVKEEVMAVRHHAGLFDIGHMGEFIVEGDEAVPFVDTLITNDFAGIQKNKAVYSPLCRHDGTIIDDLIAYKLSSHKVLLCVNGANREKDFSWILEHKKNFDCRVSDRSNDYSLLALQGPESKEILQSLDYPLPPSPFSTETMEEVIIARTGYTGEDGLEIFCSHDRAEKLWISLMEKKVLPCGLAARDILRLEACYPLYGHELNDRTTPLDVGLKWTVKFHKKDFIGKTALSSLSPRLRSVRLSIPKGIPRQNQPVLDESGRTIGLVTSGNMSMTLGRGIALASIEGKLFPSNKKFFIKIREKETPAVFHEKPFLKGDDT